MMANLNFQQPPRSIANSSFNSTNNSGRSQFLQNAASSLSSSSDGNSNSNSVGVLSSLMASSANNAALTQQQQSGPSQNSLSSSTSLPGHVTPTSAMFNNGTGGGSSGSGGSVGDRGLPQQMPIGGGQGGQYNSLLGNRSFAAFNQVNARTGSMANNSNLNKSILSRTTGPFGLVGGGSGGLQGYPSVFGGIGGMGGKQTSEQSEFQMSNEDFPALPGTQHQQHSAGGPQQQQGSGSDQGSVSGLLMGGGGGVGNIGDSSAGSGGGSTNNGGLLMAGTTNGGGVGGMMGGGMMGMELQQGEAGQHMLMKRSGGSGGGVQTSPDGKVTNIPASMVNNQYGMVGLLTLLRESDPNLVTLAKGQDLTTLGLNLNSSEKLFPSFGGPFADQPCRPQDIDFHVPPEYLVNMSIREKLSPFQLKKYKDDLLFFLFYTNVGDRMQILVAEELQNRDWRYHIEEKVWITRMPNANFEKIGTAERGVFYYFDAQNWRRVPRDSFIDTGKLVPTSRV